MVICMERGTNDLHMVPSYHLLLHLNPDWFNLSVPTYQVVLEKRPLNWCLVELKLLSGETNGETK